MLQTQNYSQQDAPCKKIQNYIFKFSDLLGKGNFSKVYKAHHEITNEIVAIKIIELNSLKSKKLQELLFSEINVLKKLNHVNILRCFQVFTSNRNCYIITELCNEGDLESKLRKKHHLSEQVAEPIIRDIFEGLLYLAEQNVIHRDLKVANVFIHNGRAKIADFGFAKFTKTKFMDINIGSPIYMSPQGFIENIYGPKTDIWAFGVLIYELLHGQTPYNYCKTQSELKFSLSQPLNRSQIKSEISYDLQQVIMRCLQTDEQKRITAFQLAKLPYFDKFRPKSLVPLSLQLDNFNTPTSNSKKNSKQIDQSLSKKFIMLSFDNNRQIQFDKSSRENNLLSVNNTSVYNRGVSPLNGFKKQNNLVNEVKKQNSSIKALNANKFQRIASNIESKSRERGFTSHKTRLQIPSSLIKSIQKRDAQYESISRFSKVVSSKITFKQTVNLLHYGRLIFKFILFLKEQQNWQLDHIDQVFILTKWLFLLLDEVAEKIENKEIYFEGGTNQEIREKKLIEVTSEYQKKYRKQLQTELIEINLKNKHSSINLDYVLKFLYNMYLKYDKSIFSNQSNKSSVILGHNVIMLYESTHILKKCYDQGNYYLLENYRDIEVFLSKTKQLMDLESYCLKKKNMSLYA